MLLYDFGNLRHLGDEWRIFKLPQDGKGSGSQYISNYRDGQRRPRARRT